MMHELLESGSQISGMEDLEPTCDLSAAAVTAVRIPRGGNTNLCIQATKADFGRSSLLRRPCSPDSKRACEEDPATGASPSSSQGSFRTGIDW
jgi:hypothetical protein